MQHCDGAYGVVPRPLWIAEEFGGAAGSLQPSVATNKKTPRTRAAPHVAPRRTHGAARAAVLPRGIFCAAALRAERCGADERRRGLPPLVRQQSRTEVYRCTALQHGVALQRGWGCFYACVAAQRCTGAATGYNAPSPIMVALQQHSSPFARPCYLGTIGVLWGVLTVLKGCALRSGQARGLSQPCRAVFTRESATP